MAIAARWQKAVGMAPLVTLASLAAADGGPSSFSSGLIDAQRRAFLQELDDSAGQTRRVAVQQAAAGPTGYRLKLFYR